MDTPLKRCTKCEREFPATAEYFYVSHTRASGFDPHCKRCRAEYQRVRYQANKERVNAVVRSWSHRHPDKTKAKYTRRREKYPDKAKVYSRHYRKEHPEQTRAHASRRRASLKAALGTHDGDDIKRQYKAQEGKCYWCGEKVGKTYHVDHVIPLAKGGSNGPDNLVIACPHCNETKGDKLPHEWHGNGGKLL